MEGSWARAAGGGQKDVDKGSKCRIISALGTVFHALNSSQPAKGAPCLVASQGHPVPGSNLQRLLELLGTEIANPNGFHLHKVQGRSGNGLR